MEAIYKIKFVKNKFKDIMIKCGFIQTLIFITSQEHEYFTSCRLPVKTVDEESVLKYIDTFLLNLIRSCFELSEIHHVDTIKRYVEINNGIILSDEQVYRYLKMIDSERELNTESIMSNKITL